jgi:hypothetical protein
MARADGRAYHWLELPTLTSPVGTYVLEQKPFAPLASMLLVDASGGPLVTITHSSIGLGSIGAVA